MSVSDVEDGCGWETIRLLGVELFSGSKGEVLRFEVWSSCWHWHVDLARTMVDNGSGYSGVDSYLLRSDVARFSP